MPAASLAASQANEGPRRTISLVMSRRLVTGRSLWSGGIVARMVSVSNDRRAVHSHACYNQSTYGAYPMNCYTFQKHSESGSLATPDGTQGLCRSSAKADARLFMDNWLAVHRAVGADPRDASLLVWCGRYRDVTDQYPDFRVVLGPRGGLVWERV
jgi:hypothetical protein